MVICLVWPAVILTPLAAYAMGLAPWSLQELTMGVRLPSRNILTPSSLPAPNLYVSLTGAVKMPVQRTMKLSDGPPGTGEPVPQWRFMLVSVRVRNWLGSPALGIVGGAQ